MLVEIFGMLYVRIHHFLAMLSCEMLATGAKRRGGLCRILQNVLHALYSIPSVHTFSLSKGSN